MHNIQQIKAVMKFSVVKSVCSDPFSIYNYEYVATIDLNFNFVIVIRFCGEFLAHNERHPLVVDLSLCTNTMCNLQIVSIVQFSTVVQY